ncbi:uncharacterized protein LOC115742492 isoform X2 [Rhodamnia argentea]|uniref:Uncharacterized protein LOC115742492 isoform X2 n=1 Tax=Rhodamnia argentea TaxID=178133 RepID=A0ABM3HQZ9_9MYRT|nr:uncharacterized protein LOC115742492 isoform X2 [Rhodamnia argentea]XP_048139022.1 uncharacterized protein LOC115742492 isoform X2 [Rhodamnia argentea]
MQEKLLLFGALLNHLRQGQAEFPLEDEVEVPDFGNDHRFSCSPKSEFMRCTADDDEMISDDEESCLHAKLSTRSSHGKIQEVDFHASVTKEKESPTLSVVVKDAGESVHPIQSASCSLGHATRSRANHCSKASKGKAKAKLSFGFRRKDEHLSCIVRDEIGGSQKVCEQPEIREDVKGIDPGYHGVDASDDFDQEENEDSEVMPSNALLLGHRYAKHSMADLLDGLHDSSSLPNSGRKRQPRMGFANKRSTFSTGQGKPDDEGELEAMDSKSPSEDESNLDELKLPAAYRKRQSMADCIQQVLDSTPLDSGSALITVPKSSGVGLFGKLQQVMQVEKESEQEFLKRLQAGASASRSGFIDVMILSKNLDAKLTVCLCSLEQNQEGTLSSHCSQADLTGRKRTVIFNPRICNDVDLEIGNLIRIYSPWKEVQVMGYEKGIILSTCFSHVSVGLEV